MRKRRACILHLARDGSDRAAMLSSGRALLVSKISRQIRSWNWIRVALERCSTCYFATSDQRDSRVTHTRESCSTERSRIGTLYRYTVIKERSLTISTRGIVSYPLIARDNLACILQCYMYPAHVLFLERSLSEIPLRGSGIITDLFAAE